MIKFSNNYSILRHGEAASNRDQFTSSWPEKRENPVTKEGLKQLKNIIPKIKKEKIDLIFSSDLLRTTQTAQIVGKELSLKPNFDKRLREIDFGSFNDKPLKKWEDYFKNEAEKFIERPPNGENRRDIRKRLTSFIKDIEKNYKHKNILIISHEDPLIILQAIIEKLSEKQMLDKWQTLRIDTGGYKEL